MTAIWMKFSGGGVLCRNEIEFEHEMRKAGFHGGVKIGKGDSATIAKLWRLLSNECVSFETRGKTLVELASEGKL